MREREFKRHTIGVVVCGNWIIVTINDKKKKSVGLTWISCKKSVSSRKTILTEIVFDDRQKQYIAGCCWTIVEGLKGFVASASRRKTRFGGGEISVKIWQREVVVTLGLHAESFQLKLVWLICFRWVEAKKSRVMAKGRRGWGDWNVQTWAGTNLKAAWKLMSFESRKNVLLEMFDL